MPHSHRLTVRETEVLSLVAQGLDNKEIAGALCISVFTVQNHVRQILERLEARNRTEAAHKYRLRCTYETSIA